MTDPVATVVRKARAAGIIDDRAAETMIALHRQDQTSDLADAPEAVRQATERFGKFVLVEMLGEGGMGEVWKAWQPDLRRYVALKFVKGDDPEDIARFIREAQTAAKLSHPNIVSTHEAGEHEGRHYISMDCIDGDDLKKRRVDVRKALELIRDAAEAVHYAHEQGIVHRDIKPQNLMLSDRGRLLVMDFGLARSTTGAGLSMSGTVVGTPYYMSPEQALGKKVDARGDVYSLGATLYELVTGHPPFEGKSLGEVLRLAIEEDPTPPRKLNPKLDRDVETIIQKAMEKDPAKRYATAKALAEELSRELAGEPIAARPIGTLGRLAKRARRNKPAAAAIGALVVLVIGVTVGMAVSAAGRAREIARKKSQARAAGPEAALPIWAELRGLAPGDPEVVESFTKLTGEVERLRRARELFAEAERAAGEQRAAREGLEEQRKKRDEVSFEPWEPLEKKIPKFDAERAIRRLEDEAEVAFFRRWAILTQVTAVDERHAKARAALAEICWERFEQTEQEYWKEQVRAYDDGAYAERLKGEGRLALSSTPAARVTAYPYEEASDTRLLPGEAIELGTTPLEAALEAGSYLLILSAEGFRDTRYPVLIERGGEWKEDVRMYTDAEIGEGWVYVPGGPFIAGGDEEAPGAWARKVRRVDGFVISTYEVTMEEYEEFINAKAAEDESLARQHVPRNQDQSPLWEIRQKKAVYDGSWKRWPVLGLSWDDVDAYCKWRSAGDPDWEYRLPSEEEWEKAARGVDGRYYPWGDTFDWTFSKGGYSREGDRRPEVVGGFEMDESAYGIRDLGGSVQEWCDGWYDEKAKLRPLRGGAWSFVARLSFRSAARDGRTALLGAAYRGFRLVRAPEGF